MRIFVRGFDISRETDGHGLSSIKERATALGGDFEIVSQTGQGTNIALKVPFTSSEPPPA